MKIDLIELEIQNFSQDIVINNIDPQKLKEIKMNDKKPEFKIFKIAHTGKSNTTVVGLGKKVLTWISSAIQNLHEKIKVGLKVFYRHTETNVHTGREIIGEVVGKFIDYVQNMTNSYSIVYIFPKYSSLKLDVASYEGNLNISPDGNINPEDIGDVTGLALGNSETDTPAFEGATFQMAVQMFAESLNQEKEKKMEISEVLEFIKNQKVRPSDLFDRDTLEKDEVVKIITFEKDNSRKYYAERMTQEKTELEKKIKELENQIKEKEVDIRTSKAEKEKEGIIEERKLNDGLKKYINHKWSEFKASGEKEIKEDINIFLDQKIEEYKKMAEAGIISDNGIPKSEPKKETVIKRPESSSIGYSQEEIEALKELGG